MGIRPHFFPINFVLLRSLQCRPISYTNDDSCGNAVDLPLQLQTAYQDLMQHHQAQPPLAIEGSILLREKGGRGYWVARRRAGEKTVEEAIGPDTLETRAVVDAARQQGEVRKRWLRETAADVAVLRAGRCPAPDMLTGRLLAAIAKTGFFAAGGVLGGTQAFRHYPLELGLAAPRISFLMTGDVDLLAPSDLTLAAADRSLTNKLGDLGIEMEAVFPLDPGRPPKWRVGGRLDLEFLSPMARGGEVDRFHEGIGEEVQALKFLDFSLENPIEAVSLYRSGVSIKIPSPQRYALHKLIVSRLRTGAFQQKRQKDLDQAEWLIGALAERRPFELWEALDDLRRRGPRWRKLLSDALAERPNIGPRLKAIEEEFGQAGG